MVSTSDELLRLEHVFLDYGQVEALKDVSLTLHPGTVHAVVGEHGAGKSSLGMVISGTVRPRRGSLLVGGRRYDWLSTRQAHRLGIEMVPQQVQLNTFFSVAENIFFLDKSLARRGIISQGQLAREARSFLHERGFSLDPAALVKNLNLPDRVLTSILAALQKKPRLLILDEALERLSSPDLPRLLHILREMKAGGMAVLFITHRIDDVYDIADRVSIVKNGEILVTDDVVQIDKMNLLRLTYTQLYSLAQDGSRRREFNQFLKYNEAVLLDLPVNLIVVDAEERVKIVNERCKAYFRVAGGEYANQPLEALLGQDNREPLALIREALTSEEGSAFYHVPLRLAGAETANNLRTLPIYDEERLIGNIIIIEDVTEFDRLQKQVILSEKLASVGLLAAGVAHEINNPLEIVYNYLKFLKYSFDDARLHQTVDELQEEITYIAQIVRDLLSLSGTAQVERETIDINDLIGSTISLLRHSAREKGIRITFTAAEPKLDMTVNRNEIKQVILNLVKNSFEAMPGGGEIRIDTVRDADDHGREWAAIVVSDTGPGIPEAELGNVFVPFYSTRKGNGENVGLGLSICYGIVKRHSGTMSVRNLERAGCQFTIRLPRGSGSSAAAG